MKYRVGHTKPIELCAEERRVRTTSIPVSQRDGPGDWMCTWEHRTRWVTSAHEDFCADGSVWGGLGFGLGWRKAWNGKHGPSGL